MSARAKSPPAATVLSAAEPGVPAPKRGAGTPPRTESGGLSQCQSVPKVMSDDQIGSSLTFWPGAGAAYCMP